MSRVHHFPTYKIGDPRCHCAMCERTRKMATYAPKQDAEPPSAPPPPAAAERAGGTLVDEITARIRTGAGTGYDYLPKDEALKIAAAWQTRLSAAEQRAEANIQAVGALSKEVMRLQAAQDTWIGQNAALRVQVADAEEERDAAQVSISEWKVETSHLHAAIVTEKKRADAAEKRASQLEAILFSDPWPAPDVLLALADATDHLLNDHSCDHERHEEKGICRDRAREIAALLLRPEPSLPSTGDDEEALTMLRKQTGIGLMPDGTPIFPHTLPVTGDDDAPEAANERSGS